MSSASRGLSFGIKTIPEIFEESIENYVDQNLYLSVPAVVINTSKYSSQQVIDVKPLIGVVYPDGTEVEPAALKSIFVKLPHGGDFSIQMPIKVGDLVTLHWTHRSLNSFLNGDGSSSLESLEANFQPKDCYATHGFGTRRNNLAPSTTNFVIKGPKSNTVITPEGDITTTCVNSTLSCQTATVNASTSVTITSPISTFNGNVQINGALDVSQTITGMADLNIATDGIFGGGVTATGVVGGSDLIAGGVSYLGHTHIDSTGNPTQPPTVPPAP